MRPLFPWNEPDGKAPEVFATSHTQSCILGILNFSLQHPDSELAHQSPTVQNPEG
jgi:hypothetical protein